MLPAATIEALGRAAGAGNVTTEPAACLAYAYDNTRKIFMPDAVVYATDTEQVASVVRLCREHRLPLTPRGRGTGTSGGSLAVEGGVVLSMERMRNAPVVDAANRQLRVQPGVTNQEVQAAAEAHGLFWPPDPSSNAYCTVGGNIATNAGGPRCVKYGATRDNVLALVAVTGAGDVIHAGFATSKLSCGYDLVRLLVGSEGTLAVVTEATLRLVPRPQRSAGLTAAFSSLAAAGEAVVAIMGQAYTPAALEIMDGAAIELIRKRHPDLVPDAQALLMIEVDAEPEQAVPAILGACRRPGLIHAGEAKDGGQLWAARKALSPLLRDVAPKKINEDVVVPVAQLPELLAGVTEAASRYRLANVNFGHAGNGNIHVNLLIDPDDPDQRGRAERCLGEVFGLVLNLGGALSGEHGIGIEKRPFMVRALDDATRHLMKGIKACFDPDGILNPGKVLP